MTTVKNTTNTDPRARLAAAQAAIAEVDNHELMLQRQAEERRQKKAQAIATLKATLPEVLRADIATEKDALAAIGEANKKAAQAAQAKLQTAAAAIDKILADARNALNELDTTYAQYEEYAAHIHGLAFGRFEEILELDRDGYVQSLGQEMAQLRINETLRGQYATFIGRLPEATAPIVAMLLAIQSNKNPVQRRLLQGIVWAISNAPNGSTPDPSSDWQPPTEYTYKQPRRKEEDNA